MQCILMNEIYKIGIGTTTTANRDDAETIANILLNENLVSCVQIIEGIRSKFIWDGKIQEVTECKLTVKFKLNDTEKIENRIIELHKYDTPQWVYWSANTYSSFHGWVDNPQG